MAELGRARGGALREQTRRWYPAGVLVASILSAAAFVLPTGSRNPLVETTLWSLLVIVAFAGWGSLVRFVTARREHVDVGLRIVWGASALCALAGLLSSFALMTRAAAFLCVESGLVLAIATLVVERDAVRSRFRSIARVAAREPRLALIAAVLAGFVALHYLAGISEWHTNPYDDDIAYLAFTKKLLDTGTVLEPFSLRRLSALGGQTFFLELVSLRAVPSQAHTFDRSICVLMIVLLILGHRDKSRRVPWAVSFTTIALLLVLPNIAINTASYYSGVAFFLGLFRTLLWVGRRERTPWHSALPLALVGAATCTLRQNYLLVPAAVLGVSYAFRFFASREPRGRRLVEPALAAAFSVAALIPWSVVGWQSNRTFFYPVMLGTANPAMQFQSGASTLLRELNLLVWTVLEGIPLKTFAFFILAAALVREKDPRRPLWSYLLGSGIAFVALVHSLTQGDATTIGRYAFGFLIALALATVLVTTTGRLGPAIRREHVAAGVAMFGVFGGLVGSRDDLFKFYARATHNIEELGHSAARSSLTEPPEAGLYRRLQDSVPAGARLAVMLDEPYHLDYRRNPIWNLDMPGYASLPPGIPYFVGSARLEEYLRGIGVRYLAFVRIGYSRYHYRRDYWVQEVVDEQEVWRAHAPYLIDFMDNLTEIESRHRSAFDDRGMVVVDLEAPR